MKRITPGTVTVGVLAILFGLVSAYVARQYLEQTPVARAAAKAKTVAVVIANHNLPKYSRIRDTDLSLVQVPPDSVPEGTLRTPSRALGRLAKNTIMAGQSIKDRDLFGIGQVPMLSDQLPPGYQAVTLSVDANSALNGMIQPESVVDVAVTVTNDRPEVGGLATLTLVRGVKVLATSEARFPGTDERPSQLRNITVAVTPEQANKLILAQRYGTLSVSLCSTKGGELLAAKSDSAHNLVNTLDLLGLPAPKEVIEPIPEEPPVKTAQIWRGGSMVEVTFDASAIQESRNATAVAEGQEPETLPVSSQKTAPAKKKGCATCGKKKGQQPTAAPAKPTAAAPGRAGGTTGQGPIMQVQVEAHQVGR